MKKIFMLFLAVFMYGEGHSQSTPAQIEDRCRSIYVWDFTDQDKKKNRTTDDVTNAVEETLINIEGCNILERRALSRLLSHQEDQTRLTVTSASDLKNTSEFEILKREKAKLVLFGKVDMSARDNYEITLTIENLITTQILRKKSSGISAADLLNIDKRNATITKLVYELLGKEYKEEEPKSAKNGRPDENTTRPKPNPPASNYVPDERMFIDPIKDVFPGIDIQLTSVSGHRSSQTVTINFTLINRNAPNQLFGLKVLNGFAQDNEGNQYPLMEVTLAGDKRTGKYSEAVATTLYLNGRLKCSVTFANIMPSVTRLNVATIPVFYQLNGDYRKSTSLELGDTPISW